MDDKLIYLMREINKNFSIGNRIYGEFSNENNINIQEASILYSLLIFKNNTQNDICNEYSMPKQTVNNIIKKLEEKKFVELKIDNNDKRKKIISLTDEGFNYAKKILDPMIKCENNAAKMLGEEKLMEILKSIKELNSYLQKAFKEVI